MLTGWPLSFRSLVKYTTKGERITLAVGDNTDRVQITILEVKEIMVTGWPLSFRWLVKYTIEGERITLAVGNNTDRRQNLCPWLVFSPTMHEHLIILQYCNLLVTTLRSVITSTAGKTVLSYFFAESLPPIFPTLPGDSAGKRNIFSSLPTEAVIAGEARDPRSHSVCFCCSVFYFTH